MANWQVCPYLVWRALGVCWLLLFGDGGGGTDGLCLFLGMSSNLDFYGKCPKILNGWLNLF